MKTVYLDTSAFFKLFFDETDGNESIENIALLAKQYKIKLVISEWVVNESVWAATRKHLNGKIGRQDSFILINHIADLVEDGINNGFLTSYAINEKVVIPSRVIIQELHTNASDALHVFVAATSDCHYFITADKELKRIVKDNIPKLIPIDIQEINDVVKFFDEVNSDVTYMR